MSVPSIMIEPSSGFSRPTSALRNTDLPVPEGPSITETSPAGIVSETPPQISCLPNDLLRLSILISTPTSVPSLLGHCTRQRRVRSPISLVGTTDTGRRSYARVSFPAACRLHLQPPHVWTVREMARGAVTDSVTAPRGGAVRAASLDGDGGAGGLEGLLGLVRGSLVDLLEDGLRGGLNEVLGLLQTERGEAAHLLDDVDLLLARGLEDDVELVLLGSGVGATSGTAGGGGSSNGNGGSSGDAEGLHELAELDEGHFLERVEQLVGGELRHGGVSFHSVVRGTWWSSGPGFRWCVPS